MKTISLIDELKSEIKLLKAQGKSIGFVPSMGYLHEGHLSLVRASIKKTDCTVVSIFVNPTQFSPNEDFKKYPRDIMRDTEILKKEGVHYLFTPQTSLMYPHGYKTFVEVRDFEMKLCGRSRPNHFKGVCTVVLKLLNIVDPDISFFGQKDAQQAIILKKMGQDLNLDVKIEVFPIVRDKDGLALSSRNTYLNAQQRISALSLSRSLREAQRMIERGERNPEKIILRMKEIITSTPFTRIDYIEVVDIETLDPLPVINEKALIALAVFIDKIRLIDNTIICIKE